MPPYKSIASRQEMWLCLLILMSLLAMVDGCEPMHREKSRQPMRIIVFGAHPDDCELEAGGTAARWAKIGYKVKFVSVTNGDIGHHQMAGAILARRRTEEVKQVRKILGIDTEVLDIHDGELLPTLENRRIITRKIREWKADVVIAPRPNDYHPDHRYTGISGPGCRVHGHCSQLLPDVPALEEESRFPLHRRRLQEAKPVLTRHRRANRSGI